MAGGGSEDPNVFNPEIFNSIELGWHPPLFLRVWLAIYTI